MIARIQRQYILKEDEVKNAIYDYLKKMDKPVPEDSGELAFSWNGNKECFVDYKSEIIK
jgi:hypothetical protein